tara:strand:- start:690 stop:1235 length:546 start_codon:yes stop_codon:yes gene_type:complete
MSLDLVVGCMFSGKSTELIRIVRRLETISENYIVIKPKIDTRYSANNVSTHDKVEHKCIIKENLISLFEDNNYMGAKHIIIEEAQFFPDLEPFVLKAVDDDKKHITVVGLDGDSNRNNFGQMHKLYPLCDSIIKLKALCLQCNDGTEAIFSKRIIEEKQQTSIGSNEKYIAVCRPCFLNNK